MARFEHFDELHLYRTRYGSVRRHPAGEGFDVRFRRLEAIAGREGLRRLKAACDDLVDQVRRHGLRHRWQLRAETEAGHATAVLHAGEVFRLHELLEGAVAMLELERLLDEQLATEP